MPFDFDGWEKALKKLMSPIPIHDPDEFKCFNRNHEHRKDGSCVTCERLEGKKLYPREEDDMPTRSCVRGVCTVREDGTHTGPGCGCDCHLPSERKRSPTVSDENPVKYDTADDVLTVYGI